MLSIHPSSSPPFPSSNIQRHSTTKSQPTCTITLANASTHHSTYSSIQISVLPFPQPQKQARSPHPLKPVNRLRPHPLLPVQNVERSVVFPPSEISKSDLPPSPAAVLPGSVPRQRACSIKSPRRKRPPPTLPIQFAKASATTTDAQGVTTPAENQPTSAVPQEAGTTPPPHTSALRPKKPSSDLRWGALVQRSVTRGLPVCSCLSDASMTSSPPSSPTKRCSSSFDSFSAQSYRLAQRLYTRLLGKGLETTELISPPPLHRSVSTASLNAGGTPPSSPTKHTRSSSDGDLPLSPPVLHTPPPSPTKRAIYAPHLILPNETLVANMVIRRRHRDRASKPRHLGTSPGSCAASESNSGSVDEEKQRELEEDMGRKMFCPRWEVSRPKRSSPLKTAVSTSTTLQDSP